MMGGMSSLGVRPDGALDLVSLGALVHRLDPGVVPFRKASECRIHVSGGEFNVAANLAACFGLRTGIVTAMVDYPIGELVEERVRALGVTPFYKRFAHDGVRGPNLATVYSDLGYGVRAPVVFYNRANEAAALLGPGDIDWPAIFARGVRWFHAGGIFASLGENTALLIAQGMQAAKAAGAVTSFDFNYRAKLWAVRGGASNAAAELGRIVALTDVLLGGEDDFACLGIPRPEAAAAHPLDPARFWAMLEPLTRAYPNLRVVATTLRDVHSTNRHSWSAAAWSSGAHVVAPRAELDVFDRVGSGDGFASGLVFGLLSGASLDESVRLGWAHGALVATTPGDTTMATLEEVRAVAAGVSAKIQR
jgi:2-dehydro-3-deoxygluconokinase